MIGGENLVKLREGVVEKIGRRGLRTKTRDDDDGSGAIDGDIRFGGVAFRGVALGFVERDDHIALPAGNDVGGGICCRVAAGIRAFVRRDICARAARASVQGVLNAAPCEHHDQRKREKNDQRANEPGRAGPAAAPAAFPVALASAGRIGEALAHVRLRRAVQREVLRARCAEIAHEVYATAHDSVTARGAVRV